MRRCSNGSIATRAHVTLRPRGCGAKGHRRRYPGPRASYASTVSAFLDAQGKLTPIHFLINDMPTTCDLIRTMIGPQTHIKATGEARPQWSDRTIERYLDDTLKKDDRLFTGCRVLCTMLVDR